MTWGMEPFPALRVEHSLTPSFLLQGPFPFGVTWHTRLLEKLQLIYHHFIIFTGVAGAEPARRQAFSIDLIDNKKHSQRHS